MKGFMLLLQERGFYYNSLTIYFRYNKRLKHHNIFGFNQFI